MVRGIYKKLFIFVGLIAVSAAFVFATVLFGIAALLAFLGRNTAKTTE